MENSQKAILIGVGIFITIIIIAAVMLITGMGQDLINNSEDEFSSISSSLQAQLTSNFDEKQMTGAQVIAAVKTYYMYDNLAVAVQNKLTKSGENCIRPGGGCILWGTDEMSYFSSMRATSQISNISNSSLIKNNDIKNLSQMYDRTNKATYVRSDEKFIAKLIKYRGEVVGIFFKRTETLD